ncbi:MAG: AraC family transcriptional regulator [Woeseiaceae bacterium]
MKVDYIDRIKRVVDFLNKRVDSSPSLEELAKVARISPYHFHRVYRGVTGETPFGTLRRLRIVRAAVMLRDTEKSITEIAFDVGYDSSQAFSRAFRQLAGCSASEARSNRQQLLSLIKKLSGSSRAIADATVEVRLVSVKPFKVIASRHRGPPESLFQAFGDLHDWAQANPRLEPFRGIYGIPIDEPLDEYDDGPRFDCCFDFGPNADSEGRYREVSLGDGLYAVTRHVGPYEGLETKYDSLYGRWLTSSQYKVRDAWPYNHYLVDPSTLPPAQWETDIHIPIEEIT